jgi:DNA-binding transcriptional LysR family regulator
MHDLNAMFLFAKVVEHGGYTAAARALGMQTSNISRHVTDLEKDLGVRLLNRTTRRMSVTDVGQTFYQHCAALVAEAEAATETIDRVRSIPQGVVRMSCPAPLLETDVAVIVARYLVENPQVRVQVDATSRRVNVIEEGLDLALRVRRPPLEDSGLAMRALSNTRSVLVGSPRLFGRQSRPAHPDELMGLPTLEMTSASDKYLWEFETSDGKKLSVSHTPRLMTDDFATLRQAAIEGVGIVRLPYFMVRAGLADGSLELLLPDFGSPEFLVHAVFPSRRGLVPAVRVLLDALVTGFDRPVPGTALTSPDSSQRPIP